MKNKILLVVSIVIIIITLLLLIIIPKSNIETDQNNENQLQEKNYQNIQNESQDNQNTTQNEIYSNQNTIQNELNNNQNDISNEEKTLIDNNDDLVHELKCNFKDIIDTFYKKQNISIETMDNQTKLKMILERVYNPYDEPEAMYIKNDGDENEYITKTDFEKVAKRVLGENANYKNEDVSFSDIDIFTDTKFKFNQQKQRYDISYSESAVKAYAIPYIDKVYKYNDRIEMTIFEYYVEDTGKKDVNIYSNYDYDLKQFKNRIATNISANYIYSGMEQILEDGLIQADTLASYKMTFKLKNSKYYFDKFEKIN